MIDQGQHFLLDRRIFIVGGTALFAATGSPLRAAATDGNRLFADVDAYARLGEHRTGTKVDVATSKWISRRLRAFGMSVKRTPFDIRVFEPTKGELRIEESAPLATFPVWPPIVTPAGGLSAQLTPTGRRGGIAVVTLPYTPNASLLTSAYADPIAAAVAGGAAAVIGITEGPTGEIIALNAVPDRHRWPVPVALSAGRDGARLTAAAARGLRANLRQEGRSRDSCAYNIVASRPGTGPALVISTPTSGWFNCAGERGAGVALFLALAEWSAKTIMRPVIFVATSGHEIEGRGSEHALGGLPPPSQVGGWLHLGANLAGADVTFANGRVQRQAGAFTQRGARASQSLLPIVAQSFAGVQGYSSPQPLQPSNAVGDIAHYAKAGYHPILGLVAAHPLHHTRLDVAQNVTSPELLAELLPPLKRVLIALASQETRL